jgi:nucleotide-binding universal stress UspA family protein
LADDARVTLLHVVPGSLPPGEQRHAERDATRALADEVRHLRKQLHEKVSLQSLVKVGAPAKDIAASAADMQADLVVMGRCGRRPLRDVFLGSTAERVIRQAQLPVLVVRLAARVPYSRPALALDLDQAAIDAVRLMLLAVPPPRPAVEVIHAVEAPYRGMIYASLTEDEAEHTKQILRSTATQELAKLLATAAANADVQPGEEPLWKTQVRYGSPRVVVEKAVKKAETDLLVLGTHGYSGVTYVFLGTVAGDLLRAAQCDVLVVPPAAPRA